MTNLPDFLLARIAEDESVIKGRDMSRPIHFVGCYYYEHTLDANLYCDCDEDGSASRRYLAECDAKRRIVEPWRDGQDEDNWRYGIHAAAHEHMLRLLALPYADHPDYREAWRP